MNTPCYQMFARKSNDNGVTWQPDMPFSDVVSPLPAQPDPGIVGEYVSDHDFQIATATSHRAAWVDGRVAINGTQQQDALTDSEPSGGSTPTPTPTPGPITLSAVGLKVEGINTVRLTWSGATSATINIYRDEIVVATVPNTGSYTDSTGDTGRARYIYRVCEAGTQIRSNNARVTFRQ